jgi:hypothetical protein
MAPTLDLTGQRFGSLTAIEITKRNNGAFWLCICDCGKHNVVRASYLRNGSIKSCGCKQKEQALLNLQNQQRRLHWISVEIRQSLHQTYQNMIARCYYLKNNRYENYGGRGIRVCDKWIGNQGRERFYFWAINNGYKKRLQIDRIDVDKNYSESNCRFVDRIIQANNKTNNKIIIWRGESKTMAEWAREFNISYAAMQHRVIRKWPMERILSQPQRKRPCV